MLCSSVSDDGYMFLRFARFHLNCSFLLLKLAIYYCIQKVMEDCSTKRISIETKLKLPSSGLSHHTSLQYGATFFSKNPIFKRNRSSEIARIENVNKQQIFDLVFKFIGKLIIDSEQLKKIFNHMKYEDEDKQISVAKITFSGSEQENSENSITSNQLLKSSFKEIQQKVDSILPQHKLPQVLQEKQKKKKQGRQAKVSIMVGSFSDFSSQSRLSSSSFSSMAAINFPPHIFTLDMIRLIFQEPEPLLINLAICLMLKFLFYSKMPLTGANACWILSISTIIAYKIYYDEPVGGLIDSFSSILQVNRSQIMDLEGFFLGQISFQAAITSEQYHIMLSEILK